MITFPFQRGAHCPLQGLFFQTIQWNEDKEKQTTADLQQTQNNYFKKPIIT